MDDLMEKLVALCKRRGFIFQSSEIYGGINGFWDYGPLGVELKRNVKEAWWHDMVTSHDDTIAPAGAPGSYEMVGLDSAIIMNPKVWVASGHVGGFADPMVDCAKCKRRFRADRVVFFKFYATADWAARESESEPVVSQSKVVALDRDDEQFAEIIDKHRDREKEFGAVAFKRQWHERGLENPRFAITGGEESYSSLNPPSDWERPCPAKGCDGQLTPPRSFNLMFKTFIGALEDESAIAYLRPETAQGIFANFKNVLDTARVKLPFGIAQVGKAFRNEINPRNYTFRSREFEQMEIEFFCRPEEAPRWYEYWRDLRLRWYVNLGLKSDRLRLREHEKDELAHYAAACADVEYSFPFGVSELEGVANRTDFDLKQHSQHSGKDLSYFNEETRERFIPYVIEPSAGVDRSVLAFLCEAYTEDEVPDEKGAMQKRTVMKLHPRLAPVKAAVFPLVKRDRMPEIAAGIYRDLKRAGLAAFYDEKGAIGRRYRRQDEAGTPFCITVDSQTLQDQSVTVRDRDTCKQWRVAVDRCAEELRARLSG
ncbi:MAG: glycine--tRNA ligase [Planctomycetes bacterium]|nr:glycine--tRNA ligase [Planctomycetota bacterium]